MPKLERFLPSLGSGITHILAYLGSIKRRRFGRVLFITSLRRRETPSVVTPTPDGFAPVALPDVGYNSLDHIAFGRERLESKRLEGLVLEYVDSEPVS